MYSPAARLPRALIGSECIDLSKHTASKLSFNPCQALLKIGCRTVPTYAGHRGSHPDLHVSHKQRRVVTLGEMARLVD